MNRNEKNETTGDALVSSDDSIQLPAMDFEINPEKDAEPQELEVKKSQTRIGRAAQIVDGKVDNLLVVVLDEGDNVLGFEVPYGEELVVLDEDSPVSIGWDYASGEFAEPVEDSASKEA